MREVSRNERLELLLMAFSETFITDILKKYMKEEINNKQYKQFSKSLLDKTVIEVNELFA